MIANCKKASVLLTVIAILTITVAGCASLPSKAPGSTPASSTSGTRTSSGAAVSNNEAFSSGASSATSDKKTSSGALSPSQAPAFAPKGRVLKKQAPYKKVDLVVTTRAQETAAKNFAKKHGFKIELNSGFSGILTLPSNFKQTIPSSFKGNSKTGYHIRHNIGAYFKSCNEKSKKYGLDFSPYLSRWCMMLSFDTQKNGAPCYLYTIFNGDTLIGAWSQTHGATNDVRETFDGILYQGEDVHHSK